MISQKTLVERALAWIKRGFSVVSAPHQSKAPVIFGWQDLRITEANAPQYFNGAQQNMGLLLGEPSK